MKNIKFGEGNLVVTVIAHNKDGSQSQAETDPTTGLISGFRLEDLKCLEAVVKVREFWTQDGDNGLLLLRAYTLSEGGGAREFSLLDAQNQQKEGDFSVHRFNCTPEDNWSAGFTEHHRNAGYIKLLGVTTEVQIVDLTVSIVGQRNRFFVCFHEGARVQVYNKDDEYCIPDLEKAYMIKDQTKYHDALRKNALDALQVFGTNAVSSAPDFTTWAGQPEQEKIKTTVEFAEVIIESGSPRTKCWYARDAMGNLFQIHYTAIHPFFPTRLSRLVIGQKVCVTRWLDAPVGSSNAADMLADEVQVDL